MKTDNVINENKFLIGTDNGKVVIWSNEKVVAEIPMQNGEYGKYEVTEIANKICKAVNNYDSLLSAFKKCYPYMHDLDAENFNDRTAGIFKDEQLTIAFESLKAAIKQAEEL